MKKQGFWRLLAATAGVLLFGGMVYGEVDAKDKALLERLNSPEWAVREAASTEFCAQTWDLARLQGLYKATTSLEARERILACARQQYFSKLIAGRTGADDPGALGVLKPTQAMMVQLAGSQAPVKALFIASPICGMPSAVVLRPGDRIVKIDQTDLTQLPADAEPFDALATRVRKTRAGESVPMVIERDGKRLEATLKVGSGIGMSAVERAGGFGARADVVERWLAEKEKIVLGAP
jgi:hypothetical protein